MPTRMDSRPLAGVAAALFVFFASFAPANAATVKVSVDVAAESTRLVLTHSEQVGYVIEEGNGRLEVIYSQLVTVEPAARSRIATRDAPLRVWIGPARTSTALRAPLPIRALGWALEATVRATIQLSFERMLR